MLSGTAANGNLKIRQVPSGSSIESAGDTLQIAEPSRSEDLEKLSLCLSEAASEADGSEKSTLFNEVLQSQLAFWTLVISVFYTYAWQQHRKKFLFSVVMVVPPVLLICMTLSMMLSIIVITGWLCSTPMNFGDVLTIGNVDDGDGVKSMSGSRYNLDSSRRRTMSGNRASILSHVSRRFDRLGSARSSSCEDLTLPKPVCRKHSTEQGSNRGLSSAGVVASHSGSRYFMYQHDLVRAASNNAVTTSATASASGLADSNSSTPTQVARFSPIIGMKTKSSPKNSAQKLQDAEDNSKENYLASEKSNGAATSGGSRKNLSGAKFSKEQEIVPDPPIHPSSVSKPFSSKN